MVDEVAVVRLVVAEPVIRDVGQGVDREQRTSRLGRLYDCGVLFVSAVTKEKSITKDAQR